VTLTVSCELFNLAAEAFIAQYVRIRSEANLAIFTPLDDVYRQFGSTLSGLTRHR